MFASSVDTLHARIEGTVNIDIQNFDNNHSLPGTSVMPILRDAGANGLSLFVQTRGQRGMVVNYGVQLRGPNVQVLDIQANAQSGIGAQTGFEATFVTTVRDLFDLDQPRARANPAPVMGEESFFTGTTVGTQLYNRLTQDAVTPRGFQAAGAAAFMPTNDPTLSMWDVNMQNYGVASRNGRTYSQTGYLFTPQIRRTNMPINDNTSLASNQGSVYYLNQNSMFHTVYIVDQTFTVIGIYIEEHGVDARSAMLAGMMVCEGYINNTLQFTAAEFAMCN